MCRLIILTLNKTQNVFIDVVYLITQQKQQEKKKIEEKVFRVYERTLFLASICFLSVIFVPRNCLNLSCQNIECLYEKLQISIKIKLI